MISPPKVRSVMGMDVTPESLPEDIVVVARAAWDKRDHQLALSYLYRGAISWTIHEMEIAIEEGDTENDCLLRVSDCGQQKVTDYFTELTQDWVNLAYGEMEPDVHAFSELCRTWPFTKVATSKEVTR